MPEQTDILDNRNKRSPLKRKGAALDRTFPPLWLMGGIVLVVIILTLLSGWKIVNLEKERTDVVTQRKLLDRDKKAFAALRQELPVLEARQEALIRENNDLKGLINSHTARLESLKTRMKTTLNGLRKTEEDRQRAENDQKRALVDTDQARKIKAELETAIKRNQADLENLSQQVSLSRAQEAEFNRMIKQYHRDVARLEADIKGLEQQRQNKQKVLARMAEDKSDLISLASGFKKISMSMENSLQSLNKTTLALDLRNKELSQTITGVDDQSNVLAHQTKAVTDETGRLTQVVKGITEDSRQINKAASSIRTTSSTIDRISGQLYVSTDKLNKRADSLQSQVEVVFKQAGRLGQVVQAVGVVEKQTGQAAGNIQSTATVLTNTLERLKKAALTVEPQANILSDQVAAIKKESGQLNKIGQTITQAGKNAEQALAQVRARTDGLAQAAGQLDGAAAQLKKQTDIWNKSTAQSLSRFDRLTNELANHVSGFTDRNDSLGQGLDDIKAHAKRLGQATAILIERTDLVAKQTDQLKPVVTVSTNLLAEMREDAAHLKEATGLLAGQAARLKDLTDLIGTAYKVRSERMDRDLESLRQTLTALTSQVERMNRLLLVRHPDSPRSEDKMSNP